MAQTERIIGTTEAAELLRMTARRVTGLCKEGKLAGAKRNGKRWQIPEGSVLTYMKQEGMALPVTRTAPARLPFAIGNTSYIEVSAESYYVDKTLLIRDLIDDHNMVTLFTRPRRFGKTLALNMLKTYFEKTEEDTSRYFADKKIWQCGETYRGYQGKYPVVMLTFKDVKFGTWDESLEAIRLVVKDEFRRHRELYESPALDGDDRDYMARTERGDLSAVGLSRALLRLTRMLALHYGEKAVILIDEYDTPIQQGYARGFSPDVIAFMRNFLSGGLKDNPHLAFGVLTGIMRISKENLFSGLNNPTVNTVLDEKYSAHFGFTESEVQEMAAYYRRTEALDELRFWYDGYRFGNTAIYNPWSVANYFASGGKPKPYWANTSENEIIREILSHLTPEIAGKLIRVMQGETVHAALDMEVVYPRMSDSADSIFSFLLLAGYLTIEVTPEETEIGSFAALRLPNAEVRRIYNTEVISRMRAHETGGVVSEIERAVIFHDGERLQAALGGFMRSTISYYDGAAESFYHGMVLGLVASLSSKYIIRSNREAGDGRFDLVLEPKEKTLPGIVMEFKAGASAEQNALERLADEALSQIDERQYTEDLKDRGVNDIVRYGIAFSGKNAAVKTRRC